MDKSMSTMEIEVYEAFTSVGINPEVAKKAPAALNEARGGELSRIESRLDKIDQRMDKIETRMGGVDSRLAIVETSTSLIVWMVGVSIAISLGLLGKALLH